MVPFLLASLAVFVAWSGLDFLIHGVLLMKAYEATADLWRPMAEMKQGLMSAVTGAEALGFTGIYAVLVNPKSAAAALKYGLIFGLATGVAMGFGSYCYMPIPMDLAAAWFGGTLVKCVVAGLLAGWIVKPA